jgi:uncharacterized membrane protein
MPEVNSSRLSPRREPPAEFLAGQKSQTRPSSVTIGMKPDEVFAFLRDVTNYQKFMRGFDDTDDAPRVVFEKANEISGQMVTWQTSDRSHTGSFTVEPAVGNRGTVLSARMDFENQPTGKVKGMLSYFVGKDPKNESYINLRRLKAYLETGEVPTTQGQPSGRDL